MAQGSVRWDIVAIQNDYNYLALVNNDVDPEVFDGRKCVTNDLTLNCIKTSLRVSQ